MAEPLSSKAWVAAWLQKAEHELETAERALNAGAPITDTAAYQCHQAAEKALKVFLALRLEPVVKTHDLMDLLTRCAAADVRFADWADRIDATPICNGFRDGDVRHSLADINGARQLPGFDPSRHVGDGLSVATDGNIGNSPKSTSPTPAH